MFRSQLPITLLLLTIVTLSPSAASATDPIGAVHRSLSNELQAPLDATIRAPKGQLRSLMVNRPIPLRSSSAEPRARALAVAQAVAPAWHVAPEELTVVRVHSTDGALVHADVVRTIEGLQVAGHPARITTTADGKLVAVTGGVDNRSVVSRASVMDAVEAVRLAAIKLEGRVILDRPAVTQPAHSPGEPVLLDWGATAGRQLAAWQRWIPTHDGLHLGWEVLYTTEDLSGQWSVWVDGSTGRLLRMESLTFFDAPTGTVFDQGSPQPHATVGAPQPGSPDIVERVEVSFAGDPVASPAGWVGPEMQAWGNNAIVLEDHDNDYGQGTLGQTAEATDGAFDFPLQLGNGAPTITEFVPAVATNIFYWVNLYHDYLYDLGFNEAAGNFQNDNFDRGGRDGDPLVVFIQQGALVSDEPQRNNAYMSTPPDGFSPTMGMYVWGPYGGGWFTDSALDAEIILHEYTHGLTGRFGRGWGSAQSGAMNEGNSDFMPLNMLVPEGANPAGRYPVATYSSQDFMSGIRTRPYSTDPTINSLTYAEFGKVAGRPEVHADGEIWAQVLWEIRDRLIDRHGFEEGTRRAAILLMDAILLSPPNPTMVEGRDAFLLADRARYGGADHDALWSAFAARGLGYAAYGGTSGDQIEVIASSDTPTTATPGLLSPDEFVVEGSSPVVYVADPNGTIHELEISTTAGDEELVPLATDGTLETADIVTARGPVTPGDGVLQVSSGEQVTFRAGAAEPITRSVRALHRVSVGGSGGIEPIEGEELLTQLVGDDKTARYELGFASEFGMDTAIYVSTNGLLAHYYIENDALSQSSRLEDITAIAPLWYDLRTDGTAQPDEGIYVARGDGWVRFRWCAETWEPNYAPGSPVNFACTVYEDGRIEFAYGEGNTGFNDAYGRQPSPTIGLGYGDVSVLVSGYDRNADLEMAAPVQLRPVGGLTSALAVQPLWAGMQAELAFTLDSAHPAMTVTATTNDSSLARVIGATSVDLAAGVGVGRFAVEGLRAGATTITLTASTGDAITVPVEIYDLEPTPIASDQLVVVSGPFLQTDAPAAVRLGDALLAPVGQGAKRQSFRLPVDATVAAGAADLDLRWNDRTLTRTVEVSSTPAEMAITDVFPAVPAPGQRCMLHLAGGPLPGSEQTLVARFETSGGDSHPVQIRNVLPDGRLLIDLPDTLGTGSGMLRVEMSTDTQTLVSERNLTIGEPELPTLQILPNAGAQVAPGSRLVLTTIHGGGLSATGNVMHIRGSGLDERITPATDTGAEVAFRLPAAVLPGQLTVTPLLTLGGVEMAGVEVDLEVVGGLAAPSVASLRASDLSAGWLEVTLQGTILPASPRDLQMQLTAGPRVRWLDAASVSLTDGNASFVLPGDLPAGVVKLSLRQRLDDDWTVWSAPAAVIVPGPVQIAAAAATEGVNDTYWQTDAAILNPADTPIAVTLTARSGVSATISVPANGQKPLANVLGGILGVEGTSPLTIEAPGTAIVASRTFNQSDVGTYGQYLPGERATATLRSGSPVELIGLAENDAFRTNLGLVNASPEPAVLEVVLRDASGTVVDQRLVHLPAKAARQINRIFATWGERQVDTGRATVRLHRGDRVHVYGSVVDNTTGDPTTIPAIAGPEHDNTVTELWVPAAAAAPGLNSTVWRTDLVVVNTTTQTARVNVELIGEITAAPISLSVGAGASQRITDVVGDGGFQIEGSGALRLTASVPVISLARVYNQAADGTFGQVMPAVPANEGLRGNEVGWLPMLAGSEGFRTNVGLVNPNDMMQRVRLSYRTAEGIELDTDLVTLDPGEWRQLGKVLGTQTPSGFVRVHVSEGQGPVLVYGSVVDNATGDPTTVPVVR